MKLSTTPILSLWSIQNERACGYCKFVLHTTLNERLTRRRKNWLLIFREKGHEAPSPRLRSSMLTALDTLVGRIVSALQVKSFVLCSHSIICKGPMRSSERRLTLVWAARGVYDSRNFEQFQLKIALSNINFKNSSIPHKTSYKYILLKVLSSEF